MKLRLASSTIQDVMLRRDRVFEGEQRWRGIQVICAAPLPVVRIISAREADPQQGQSIFRKPLNKRQKATLERIANCQAAGDDYAIDYSDILPLTDSQLAQFRRPPKVLVAARLGRDLDDWLKGYGGAIQAASAIFSGR